MQRIKTSFKEKTTLFRATIPKDTFSVVTRKQERRFFIDEVQLPQGHRATTRTQFTFYHLVPRNSWHPFDRTLKDERLSRPWSHPVVLNTGPLDWESMPNNKTPGNDGLSKEFYEAF